MRLVKRITKFIAIFALVYLAIAFTLIFWQVPHRKKIKNYDFSVLKEIVKGNAEEQLLALRDGSTLFYRFYPSEANCTFIFVHGSGSESRYLQNLASFMSENNFARVITPDLRGHGRTSKIKGDIDYLGQYEDDLEDIIRSVKAAYPDDKIILGGHSSGGGLALRYAGNPAVSKVDACILLAPYLGHEAPTVKPNSGEWVTMAIKRFVGLAMLNNVGISNLNHLPVIFFNRPAEWEDDLQAQSYSYRLTMSYQPENYIDDIKNNQVPTLVLVGESDESFHADEFAGVFKDAPNYVVKRIADTNHLEIVSTQEVKEAISEWYEQLDSSN